MFLVLSCTIITQTVPLRCTKWLPEPKKNTSDISSLTTGPISTKLHKRVVLCLNCLNISTSFHKMAPVLNIERKTTSHPLTLDKFQPNFTGMFHVLSFNKIIETGLFCWKTWQPVLIIEERTHATPRICFKQHLLFNACASFNQTSKDCSSDDPLPKLLKLFRCVPQHGCQS